jgi:transcriptional regulator with XRE-family HTH domain
VETQFASIGARILTRLKQLGLKQADLCRDTGLSTTAISQYCTDKRIPDTASLYKIAVALKTPMEWLLTGDNLTNEDKDRDTAPPRFTVYCDGIPLTESEADLVAMYRLIDEADRQTIFELTKLKYELKSGEKASSYSTYPDVIERQKSGSDRDDKPASGTA